MINIRGLFYWLKYHLYDRFKPAARFIYEMYVEMIMELDKYTGHRAGELLAIVFWVAAALVLYAGGYSI